MIQWDEYWTNYSPSEAEKWMVAERHKTISKYVDRIKRDRAKVIEVGCGSGSNIQLLNSNGRDIECYALDSSQVAIDKIKTAIPHTYLSDCRSSAIDDMSFDVIFSSGLMEHFRDERPFVNEMKRLLRPNGFIITFVPARVSLWQLYKILHFGYWPHGYEKSYTGKNLRKVFAGNGLSIVELVGIDPFGINGVIMKFFNIPFNPVIRKSIVEYGYTEIGIIAQKK